MKRHGHLYPQIIDFANLAAAARQAQRGKRTRPNVLAFNCYHSVCAGFVAFAVLTSRTQVKMLVKM